MKVSRIRPETRLNLDRGQVVVCVPVYGAHDYFVACLTSVLAHTPADVPILVCDDASPDERSGEFVAALETTGQTDHQLSYLRQPENLGFPGNINCAFAIAAPADVVVLNSDCEVFEGWLEGLTQAAYSDSRVATATSLTNHGTIVSVPYRGKPTSTFPPGWTLERAAEAVRSRSQRIRPRLPTAIGHCMYVRRSALDLVGAFDPVFTPGYGEEVDFSQRCVQAGLTHVLADDVLVLHHGGASFGAQGRNPVQERNEQLIAGRYPYYHRAVREAEADLAGPLARALGVARRALVGISVVIDARTLIGPITGTQLQVLEVIAALARTEQVRLTVILPVTPGEYAQHTLVEMPHVTLVDTETIAARGLDRADLVHRPFQIGSYEDIGFLAPLGDRLIITNQDLISFDNPGYFSSPDGWEGYRHITRFALAVADHVVFISAHGRDEALSQGLLDERRTSVVHNGIDHTLSRSGAVEPVAPSGSEALPASAPVILCLGTDFTHKNRLFALRLFAELRERHGWPGYLVFAGPHVHHGSTDSQETAWLARHEAVASGVIRLSAVSESEKEWLYQRCSLVLYPTVYEGFGLVPFEAADRGRPCLWAPVTSLAEVLPIEAAGIEPWDVEQTAQNALALLSDESARRANLEAIRSAAERMSWDRVAADLLSIYREVCDAPAAPAAAFERRYGLMQGGLGPDALRLIGPHGVLPKDVQRPLLALAMHRYLGPPMFRAMKLGYLAGYSWRRRPGRQSGGRDGSRES